MAKQKFRLYITKGDKQYRIMRYNKHTGELTLRGNLRDFKSTLAHAKQAGYTFVKEE